MKKQYFIFLLSFYAVLIYGQEHDYTRSEIITLLSQQKSYRELERNFYDVKYDFAVAKIYAEAYLRKSVLEKDTIRQADAYYLLSSVNKPLFSQIYADSIISLTESIDDAIYPAKGFLAKAIALERRGNYRGVFNYLLKALEFAQTCDNPSKQLEIKYQIGVLKSNIQNHLDNYIVVPYESMLGANFSLKLV